MQIILTRIGKVFSGHVTEQCLRRLLKLNLMLLNNPWTNKQNVTAEVEKELKKQQRIDYYSIDLELFSDFDLTSQSIIMGS